MINHRI